MYELFLIKEFMKVKHLFYFLFFTYINVFSQNYSITGQVLDYSTKKALAGANVFISKSTDKNLKGMASDNSGNFIIRNLTPGKYFLTITFVGYRTFKKNVEINNKSISLSKIYLYPVGVKLTQVLVTADPTAVALKNDTTEYNAGAFKTNKDAVAEDLLTKMPGITVQNGTVQAQGENVAKVLVDGREFFGSDPNAVLKNLPAEVIEKIQVFDQQSDQSQFTGFDDGNTSKTINIITRLNNHEGTFGKLTGGYGNDTRYAAGGNINFFNKDQRISILAQLNNVNQQNFSTEDLLGVMSGSGRRFSGAMGGGGMGGGRRGSGSGSGPGGFGGGNISNFLVNQTTGLTQTKAVGINYSDKWGESLNLTASYFFNYTNNDAESNSNTDYFLTAPAEQNYNELNSSITQNTNHRLNLRLNYQIDQDNSILFYPTFTAQINDGSSNINGITTSGLDKLNSTINTFSSNLTAINSSNNLLFRHRFETRGRTLSIGINGTFNNNTGNNNLFAKDNYYTSSTADTLNQASNLLKHGFSGSTNIVYTEPLGSNSLLQLDSKFYYSEDNSDQRTYNNSNNNTYSLLDTSLSNVYKKIYRTQSYGTGYRYRENHLSFALNLNYNIAQLVNNQSFPGADMMGRTFHSVLPSLFLRYFISRNNNLRISYYATNDDPSIDQLQNVINNSNPTQLSIGNPNLSQDYKHSLVLRYIQTNAEHMNSLFILFGGTVTQNYIGNNTIIAQRDTTVMNSILLNQGTKLTFPTNLNGYLNLRSFIAYGLPVEFIKSNLNLNLNANYSRTPGIINGITNIANSSTYGLGFVIGSNISDKFDFTLSSNSSYNFVTNSTQTETGINNNYFSQNTTFRFYWRFWEGFVFTDEINDQYNGNLPGTYKPNTLIWNMGLGIKVLSNDNGEIRLSANDLLNQNTNIQHNVSDSYIQDVRTNVLGRYFLLSFIYNIRAY